MIVTSIYDSDTTQRSVAASLKSSELPHLKHKTMPKGTTRPGAIARFKKQYLERRTSIIQVLLCCGAYLPSFVVLLLQFDEESPTHAAIYTLDLSQKDLRRLKNHFELIDLVST